MSATRECNTVGKLILKDKSAKEYPLADGVTIGSAASNTIVVDHYKVEPQHAKIEVSGEHIYIEDIDTKDGLAVNGKRVRRWALQHDDVVAIGGSLFVYCDDKAPKKKEP